MLTWPGILVLLGLVAYPLGTVLLQSVFPQLFDQGFQEFSFQTFATIGKDSYTYQAIVNAFLFGGGTALLSAILGSFFAVIVHRKWIYGEKAMNVIIWLIFFTPSYLVAEGWVLMMQDKGIISELFHLPDGKLSWFFTPGGLIAAMSFRLFPVVYLSVRSGLRGLGSEFEEAARIQGASSFRVWRKIIIPLLFPAILAGATLTFAESVSDFGFASALVPQSHIPMLTYSIFTALSQMPVNYSQVGALSVVLIGVIAVAVWSQKWILGKGSYSIIQNQIRPYRTEHAPSIGWSMLGYALLFLVYAVPMSGEVITSLLNNTNDGFILSNWTLNHYYHAVQSGSESLSAIIRSVGLSFVTAVTATVLGIGLAFVIHRKLGIPTKILYILTMSTLAIPGIVLAAGYVFAWNAPYLSSFNLNLYGTLFCLYLAYVAGSLPHSIRLQLAAITQISPTLLQAGQVHGAGTFSLFRKILLPLVSSTTISTLFLIFSHIMFELPASELLYPPDQSVLPVVIAKFYKELNVEDGAAVTVLSIGLVLVVYGFGQLLIYGQRKLSQTLSMRAIQVKHTSPITYPMQPESEVIS
ncbi:ABC transporter permease [Aneurinibacillus terranovensis]|uniref:ABC transporter permease n=1 Tax=Aneurinibacillus terranovensis TaxID=278991 RepID=UPI00040A2D69|nr:iron ABC transporter permease [Aneurinibacillus terranovensis]